MNIENYEKQIQADRLLNYGLLDQAERLYTEVLEAEPNNVEVAFGLARVALERGDEQLAYERALRAAKIKPNFDDAQRLVQRLAEILAVRKASAQGGSTAPQHQSEAVRPSEQSAFARNRSMADHRADEQQKKEKQ